MAMPTNTIFPFPEYYPENDDPEREIAFLMGFMGCHHPFLEGKGAALLILHSEIISNAPAKSKRGALLRAAYTLGWTKRHRTKNYSVVGRRKYATDPRWEAGDDRTQTLTDWIDSISR